MGKVFETLEPVRAFIEAQRMFFVASAPKEGVHINVSPKGMSGTFAILGPQEVAYLDITGSGVETIAHVRENGRISLMWCAFEGPPKIVRIHGEGRVVLPTADEFPGLRARFADTPDVRSIIVVRATRISDSCGYGVPKMDFVEERDQLIRYAKQKGPEGMAAYRAERNHTSLDGLPGLD
ncbi:MAG: pyridoxamine 5'-phosphate oxidase family protein [Myxococcota bacterium]